MNQAQRDQIDELLQAGQYEAALTELQQLAMWDDEAFRVSKRLKELYAKQLKIQPLDFIQVELPQISLATLQRLELWDEDIFQASKRLKEVYVKSQKLVPAPKNAPPSPAKLYLLFSVLNFGIVILTISYNMEKYGYDKGIAYSALSLGWFLLAVVQVIVLRRMAYWKRFVIIVDLLFIFIHTQTANTIPFSILFYMLSLNSITLQWLMNQENILN